MMLLLGLLGIAGLLVAASNSQGPVPQSAPKGDPEVGHAKGLALGLGPSEPVPATLQHRILRNVPELRTLRLRFADAYSVETVAGVKLWLVPGRRISCLVDVVTSALSCDASALVDRRGIYLATYWLSDLRDGERANFRVVGIATRTQTSIPAAIGARRVLIPVQDRTFEKHADVPIRLQVKAPG